MTDRERIARLAKALIEAKQDVEHHTSQVQGFYDHKKKMHWARDCTLPHGEQIFFRTYDNQPDDYDISHKMMMDEIEVYQEAIIADRLLASCNVTFKE